MASLTFWSVLNVMEEVAILAALIRKDSIVFNLWLVVRSGGQSSLDTEATPTWAELKSKLESLCKAADEFAGADWI